MVGEREREGGMEDEREGRGEEVGRGSNSRQNPSPIEKNKWLEGTERFCLFALPVPPGRGASLLSRQTREGGGRW